MCCHDQKAPVDSATKPEMPLVDSQAAVWPPLGGGELEEEEVPLRLDSEALHIPAVGSSELAEARSPSSFQACAAAAHDKIGYEVCFEKDGQGSGSVGVRLDLNDGVRLQVVKILEEGLVAKYNKVATEDRKIRVCDFVTEVNGVVGDAKAMVSKFVEELGETILSLWIVPAVELVVTLSNQGSLGVTLFHDTESISMLITDIDEGPISEHNLSAGPEEEIRVLDRIVAVNGTTGKASQLTSALSSALARKAAVELRILRPLA